MSINAAAYPITVHEDAVSMIVAQLGVVAIKRSVQR